MKFDDYLFRSSELGTLMVTPKEKKAVLSKGAQSYLKSLFKVEYFGEYIEMKSKYTEKGKIMEDPAIEMLSRIDGVTYAKNEDRFNNEFITGEPDIITYIDIKDIKCSWSYATFPLTDTKIKNKKYWWQLQAYMWLKGLKKAELVYCLMDTPQDLARFPVDFLKYGKIPEKKKVKRFSIDYDPDAIAQAKVKIMHAREFLNQLYDDI